MPEVFDGAAHVSSYRPVGKPMFERCFVAYGVRIKLRVDRPSLLDAIEQKDLPFGWRAIDDPGPNASFSVRYDLLSGDSAGAPPFRLCAGASLVAEADSLADTARVLGAHAEFLVAEHAPDHLFVHAGVVGWEGQAIVMPGSSFAGKTTLVQAWLEAGATYYSDEFAVLDRDGRVHPFSRPLAIRDRSTGLTRRVSAASLGAPSGTTPLPIGLVLVTSYRAGARWRPHRLTPAPALLELMRHTVAARGTPKHSMPILKRAVTGGVAFAGVRGEAGPFVSTVRKQVGAPVSWALSA